MAFIRSYSSRYAGEIMGDPFLGRLFKKIKKWQPGRTLARLAPTALSLVPGVGGLAGRALGSVLQRPAVAARLSLFGSIAQRLGVPVQMVVDVANQYGYVDEGDPGPKPRKRQGAKRSQQKKAAGKGRGKKAGRRPSGSKQSVDYGKILEKGLEAAPGLGSAAAAILKELRGSAGIGVVPGAGIVPGAPDIESQIAAQMGGGGKSFRIPGVGGRRRSMNPANVKALRRSMRRVEGFQNLVKRVNRMFPKLRHAPVPGSAPRRARGHKSGCRCAVCSR